MRDCLGAGESMHRMAEAVYGTERVAECGSASKVRGRTRRQLPRHKYHSAALLVIDEVSFESIIRNEASVFVRPFRFRYGRCVLASATSGCGGSEDGHCASARSAW